MQVDFNVIEKNIILKCVVGSQAYGISLESSDQDEKGVCIEPLEYFAGLSPFEQYEYRTAVLREHKHDAKSQPGDQDITVYSLRKFLRLALEGNPTIIELFFIKGAGRNALGNKLQELYPYIISKQCGKRFLGYMQAQRHRLLGEQGQKKVTRPELEEKYGYDTKYAVHIIRLGMQGVELMSTGRMTLPLSEENRMFCLGIRKGEIPMQDMLQRAGELERQIKDLIDVKDASPLPEQANKEYVEDWMITTYWNWWRAQRFMLDRVDLADGRKV